MRSSYNIAVSLGHLNNNDDESQFMVINNNNNNNNQVRFAILSHFQVSNPRFQVKALFFSHFFRSDLQFYPTFSGHKGLRSQGP